MSLLLLVKVQWYVYFCNMYTKLDDFVFVHICISVHAKHFILVKIYLFAHDYFGNANTSPKFSISLRGL